MAILTIKEIIEPKDRGVYVVLVKEYDTPIYTYKDRVDLMKFEHLMQLAGITDEIIEKHRELVITHVQEEQARDGECG